MIYYISITIAIAILAYLIGSINSSILISRIVMGKDIRESGSGNAGATNMLRTMGKKYAVITLIIDILKGIIAVLIAALYVRYINNGARYEEWGSQSDLYMQRDFIEKISLPYIAGLCVVIGHNFPIFFGFKGGKGVATSLGVVMMLDWRVGLVVLITALAIMAATRYVSLGSMVAALAFAVLEIVEMAVTNTYSTVKLICVLMLAVLLIARHHGNIKRLLSGTENRLGGAKK